MKNKCDTFLELINENILPRIDFYDLQESYGTEDKSYAKGILNHLHEAMVKAYGGDTLRPDYTGDIEENFVVVPGVVQSRNTGQICLALLELDLSSSGEHWQTHFLCQYGVIPQDGTKLPKDLVATVVKPFIPYDYCYTAKIPHDFHINHSKLPDGIKDMLSTFNEHTAELLSPSPWEVVNCFVPEDYKYMGEIPGDDYYDENEDDMER